MVKSTLFSAAKKYAALLCTAGVVCIPQLAGQEMPSASPGPTAQKSRKVHLIQDDAQDRMVSKIYKLKYVQGNDLVPFVSGIVMRYNINSIVDSVSYGNNQQWLTVTCPVEMMPYVDEFIAKADRNVKIAGKVPGEIIRGSGITRAVYRPLYRSGQAIADVLINSAIGTGPGGAIYAYDANSNQIYWKDNASNTSYVYQFLSYLDRPPPQITLVFTIYEIRESSLRDLGVDYLAWKNGPGLNIFQAGFNAFGLSSAGSAALQALSGPFGGFFFAPQFDASFIRMLQQNGKADIADTATMTVSNSNTASYSIYFNPQQQNIVKSDNDRTSVDISIAAAAANVNQSYAKITGPVVNLRYGESQSGYPDNEAFSVAAYDPEKFRKLPGTLFFQYLDVYRSHIDVALKTEISSRGCECNAVLTCAGFRDYFLFAHILREQSLTHTVVELVRSGVVEVLSLNVELNVSDLSRESLEVGDGSGSALELAADLAKLRDEFRGLADGEVGVGDLSHSRLQLIGNIYAAVPTKVALGVRIILEIRVEVNTVKNHFCFLFSSFLYINVKKCVQIKLYSQA